MESALPGHAAGVGYLLRALDSVQVQKPELHIVAVEMASVTPFRIGLSAPVAQAVDDAVRTIRHLVEAPHAA